MTTASVMSEPAFAPLGERMVRAGLLIPTSTPGLWGKSATFERVISGLERAIDTETIGDGAELVRFPPLIARADFERSEFLKSFPHLAGAVYAFSGDGQAHEQLLACIENGRDYAEYFDKTELVLLPAACYPVYPYSRGLLSPRGKLYDVASYCFRHEPSADPTRLVSFRMREQVRIGDAETALEFREAWLARADRFMSALELPFAIAPANDPFFGRGGRLLAASQRTQRLKFELSIPITSETSPTAVMSFNYHQDHFGQAFEIQTVDGAPAHSACVGFGLERIALALFKAHGLDPERWPASVRARLVS